LTSPQKLEIEIKSHHENLDFLPAFVTFLQGFVKIWQNLSRFATAFRPNLGPFFTSEPDIAFVCNKSFPDASRE